MNLRKAKDRAPSRRRQIPAGGVGPGAAPPSFQGRGSSCTGPQESRVWVRLGRRGPCVRAAPHLPDQGLYSLDSPACHRGDCLATCQGGLKDGPREPAGGSRGQGGTLWTCPVTPSPLFPAGWSPKAMITVLSQKHHQACQWLFICKSHATCFPFQPNTRTGFAGMINPLGQACCYSINPAFQQHGC